MPKKPNSYPDTLYFSSRLRQKLSGALMARGVVVQAPSGCGKTTAMQDFLRGSLPAGSIWIRHVCTEESTRAAWRRLCSALSQIDRAAGEELLNLGLPDEDTVGEAESLLRELKCETPTWLVVDDFHWIAALAPASFWNALLEHDSACLHVALVARFLPKKVLPYEKFGLLRLDESDLRLSEEECGEYFDLAGFPLNEEKKHELHTRTGGWMIALALHLRRWREGGEFAPASDMDGLLREVIWAGLSDEIQDLLLRLSPFDAFSAAQAAFLRGKPDVALPAQDEMFLRHNAFIRFDPASGLYAPHHALLEFVRAAFAGLPPARQRQALDGAGEWCALNGERDKAIAFYYRLRDFEKILALDLSGLEDNRLMDLPDRAYVEALRDIVAHCSPEMKKRYPGSMIQLAFEFFGQGCAEDLAALCADMEEILAQLTMPEKERKRLRGELLLLESFSRYNRIAEMGQRMRQAAVLIGGATALISPHNSWTFGNASVLLMYHRESGALDRELADMDTYTPHYSAMARGHGSGGPALMRAEALLCRGETEEAEIYGHQARHEAASHRQSSILIGAELFFGRLAVLRGDGAGFAAALQNMAGQVKENPQKSNRMEADMARSWLMGLLERPQDMVPWLRAGLDFSRRLFTQAIPCAHICRAHCLLLEKQPAILLGQAEAALGLAQALGYSLALLYGYLQIAAARCMQGRPKEARAGLEKAQALALPDRLLLPMAEYYPLLGPLLEKASPEVLEALQALAFRLQAGRQAVLRHLYKTKFPSGLSEREGQTARLAAQGLSNREIAQRLCVTEHTVKKHLKAVVRKSGATRATFYRLFSDLQRPEA